MFDNPKPSLIFSFPNPSRKKSDPNFPVNKKANPSLPLTAPLTIPADSTFSFPLLTERLAKKLFIVKKVKRVVKRVHI